MDDHKRETTGYEPNFILKDYPEGSHENEPAPDPAEFTQTYERTPDLEHTQTFQRPQEPGDDLPKPARDLSETQPIGNAPYLDDMLQPEADDVPEPEAPGDDAAFQAADTETAAPSQDEGAGAADGFDAADETSADAADEATSDGAAAAGTGYSGATAGTAGNGRYHDTPHTSPYQGAFRDPRENFGGRAHRTSGQRNAGASFGNVYNNFDAKEGPAPAPARVKTKKKAQPITLTRRSLALLIIAMMLLSVVCGAGMSLLTNSLLDNNSSTAGKTDGQSAYTLEDATGSSMSISQITSKTRASVVEIRTESVVSDSWMQQYVAEGAGSGVIISKDGYIMTNNHVIEGARKITVTTSDNKEYSASLVGTDSNNDVAVIKIDADGLTAATYGNSDQLQVGDLAVAIGNPLGELGGTVTSGIISALDRELTIDGKTLRLLQTDSSITPGNSGGGLFNDKGQLVGLVVAKSSGSGVEGLGFAIPINTAAKVASDLMEKGYVSGQPYTGMAYREASAGMDNGSGDYGSGDQGSGDFGGFGNFFGWGDGSGDYSQGMNQTGVYIAEVNGKNAKAAGFQVGDLVYAADGKVITSFDDLTAVITAKKPGDKMTYTIVRDGQTQDITFELEEKTN